MLRGTTAWERNATKKKRRTQANDEENESKKEGKQPTHRQTDNRNTYVNARPANGRHELTPVNCQNVL